jgi:hypothetical protein
LHEPTIDVKIIKRPADDLIDRFFETTWNFLECRDGRKSGCARFGQRHRESIGLANPHFGVSETGHQDISFWVVRRLLQCSTNDCLSSRKRTLGPATNIDEIGQEPPFADLGYAHPPDQP